MKEIKMIMYSIGLILILLGFLMPSLGGLESSGLMIIGSYLFFKKLNKDTNFEKK